MLVVLETKYLPQTNYVFGIYKYEGKSKGGRGVKGSVVAAPPAGEKGREAPLED